MEQLIPVPMPPKAKRASRIWGVVGWIVYLAFVAGIVVGLPRFLSKSLGTPYPMAAITSGSMWPSLKVNDLIFIQAVPKEDIKIGDVIVYRNPVNQLFTIHRVIRLGETSLTTKGDANFSEDQPVSYDTVVGRTFLFRGQPLRIPFLGATTIYASKYLASMKQ